MAGITNAGVVYGDYADYVINNDDQPGWQGFLNNNGVVTLVSFPGANITTLADINAAGTIVGNYEIGGNTNAGWIGHGFVDNNGSFTSIDVPGAYSTSVVGISDGGVIAGNYQDFSNNTWGFVDNNGVITKINIAGATSTGVSAVNAAGEVVGYYADGSGNIHGFIDNGGVIATVDVPGATQTDIQGVNATGEIYGFYNDSSGNQHGFVGTLPTTTIESFGSTSLVEVDNDYFLDGTSGGPSAELQYGGAPVVAGEFGAWTPIGVEATATGFEVALKLAGSNQFTVWNTDGGGNVISDTVGSVSGTGSTLEALELSFHQDLNGDGVIGIPGATIIERSGATTLDEISNDFFMDANGTATGPELQYGGAPVVAGEFGAWTPVGAEATATGYEVALNLTGTNQFTVWNTDSSGNVIGDTIGSVSGTSTTLELLEASFHQDLNGDGVIGIPPIENSGSTSLVGFGGNFFLDSNSTGIGPELQYGGAPVVTGEFGAWTPIGVEATATGYEVALQLAGSTQFTVWNTDGNGNVIGDSVGALSANSPALEALELSFYQDLNGDGVINSSTTVIEAKGDIHLTLNAMTQPASIDTGATLELTGANSSYVAFNGSTGTLILDHSTQFSGQIVYLTGNGSLSGSDQLDLRDIGFGPGTTVGYSGTSVGGILTVSDAQNHTAHITLAGNYTSSTFSLSSDGHGGTTVIDPVVMQDTADGTLSFSDSDPTDTHGVSVTPQNGGVGYLGSFVADAVNAANGQDTVGWHFNLASGSVAQTVTQSYHVSVADQHADGTTGTASQVVSVTIAGPGNDAFVFHPGVGAETIVNAGPSDTVELDGFSSVTSNDQLATLLNDAQTGQAQSLFQSVNGGHDTMINLGNHDSITLRGVQIADLHASNFVIH